MLHYYCCSANKIRTLPRQLPKYVTAKQGGNSCSLISQGFKEANHTPLILIAAVAAVGTASICWCVYPNRELSSNSGSVLTKVTTIYNLSALCISVYACKLVWCPGEPDFNGILIQAIAQGEGCGFFFLMRWYQGMMIPLLGLVLPLFGLLWLTHLLSNSCILYTPIPLPPQMSCQNPESWSLEINSIACIGWDPFPGILR